MGQNMTILSAATRWSALRCADRSCTQHRDCLRWIDINRQSTHHPVAGLLASEQESCSWYLDPNTTDFSDGPQW
jgi:hypothetical protein